MPTKQHTHRLPTTLITPKTPATHLREPRLLRRHVLPCRTRRRTLRHALIQILHQRIAQLAAILRLVESLKQGRHVGLPYRLQNLGYCAEVEGLDQEILALQPDLYAVPVPLPFPARLRHMAGSPVRLSAPLLTGLLASIALSGRRAAGHLGLRLLGRWALRS